MNPYSAEQNIFLISMYIRSKKVKAQNGETYEYEQLVESYRAGGKTKQRVVMTLGKKGEVTGDRVEEIIRTLMKKNPTLELVRQFDRKTPDLKIHSSKELGAYLVFRHLWEKIGLQTAVEAIAPRGGGKEKDFAEMIFLLTLYRILSPGSERRMAHIFEPQVYHRLSSVPSLNEWYRAISRLQKNRSSVEDEAYRRIKGMFPGKMSLMYFDTTSLVLFGDYRRSEIARFGMSKDKRSDKKQVVVGLVLNEHGLPVGITEENGNAVDVKNFISMLKKMKKKYGASQMIFVGDKGMNSKANREVLKAENQQYILGVRSGMEKKVSEEILKNDFEWTKAPKLEYSKNQQKLVMQLKKREDMGEKDFHTRVIERSLDGRRMVFFYNPLEKHAEETKRDQIIRALKKKVKTITGLKQLIGNKGYRSLITFGSVKKERKKGNKEQPVTVLIDHQKIERMKCFDGITVVETNTELPTLEVVKQYKQLITVEQSFSDLKSTMECRPIYHKTDTNIRGHIFINFLGLLLYYLFFHLLSGHFEESTRYEIIQALRDIQAHEVEQNGRRYVIRTELTPLFQNICSILKLKPSPRILGTL